MPDRGEERRQDGRLTNEDIEAIARRAAEIAAPTAAKIVEANFTLSVGKVAIRVFLYVCGLGGAALLVWLGVQDRLIK